VLVHQHSNMPGRGPFRGRGRRSKPVAPMAPSRVSLFNITGLGMEARQRHGPLAVSLPNGRHTTPQQTPQPAKRTWTSAHDEWRPQQSRRTTPRVGTRRRSAQKPRLLRDLKVQHLALGRAQQQALAERMESGRRRSHRITGSGSR
jgi:hypothetical protein